ncbi:MAG: hypothetical protein P4L84_03775 [Isosphaeraceae bacterium]|nr:hypothetical protein [Isosphaeraceae bacterium]
MEQPTIQPDVKGIPVVAVNGTVNVQEAEVLTPHGLTIAGTVGTVRSGTVATFGDTYTGNTATDFNAMINWGDGAITPGTVSGGNGTFAVSGSHAYSRAGNFKAQVTLNDDAPGTATATANTLFQITSSVVPGVVTSHTGPVVVFTDSVFDLALSQVGTKKKS